MTAFLYYALVGTQFLALVVLFIEIVYIAFLKPSRFQIEMLFLLVSTLIMLVGYTVEIFATTAQTALCGAGIAYIGKPFALLMSLIFISDYCGHQIPRWGVLPIGILCTVFPIVVFTNGTAEGTGHHLYYATVNFDIDNTFSPLELGRGPFYIVYMIYMIAMFAAILSVLLKALITHKSKSFGRPLLLLVAMMLSTIAGYVIYMAGVTQGYDTTMTGAALGALFLTIAFFKYKIFDVLTYAKDHALQNVSTGLLVVNDRNQPVYTNTRIEEYTKSLFPLSELMAMPDGKQVIEKRSRFFSVSKDSIEKNGDCYGKTIEIDDITAQHNYSTQLEHDVEERTKEIRNIQRSIIISFAGIVEARDNSTGVHIKRMSKYVELIAKSLRDNGKYTKTLTDEYISFLVDVAPLHDIGKLTIPDSILLKPGKLDDKEIAIMRTHAAAGARIICECLGDLERPEYVQLATEVANYHHEKWNGQGYPNQLAGTDIPLSARIAAVADVYDAIRSERCYKAPMDKPEARQIIVEGRGNHFDPDVVDAFLSAIDAIEAI